MMRNKKLKNAIKQDWDYTFLLDLMQFKMKKMQKFFAKDFIVADKDIIARELG